MIKRRTCQLELPSGALTLGQRTLLMGVLNVTPDSFSDGGKFLDAQRAIGRALEMERAGADLLDIGGGPAPPGPWRPRAPTERTHPASELGGLRRAPCNARCRCKTYFHRGGGSMHHAPPTTDT